MVVMLVVSNIEKSVEFYNKLFGLQIIADFGAKYKPGLGAALKLLIFSSVSFTIH